MFTLRDHLNQAAEFGYVRTPGHNAGCQCDVCNQKGRKMADDRLVGLYHSPTRGATIVISRCGELSGYRAIMPGGVPSVPMIGSEVRRVLDDYEYVKIGGR